MDKVTALLIIFILGWCSSSVEAASDSPNNFPFIRNTDLSKLPVKMRAKLHKQMTVLFVELEKKEKYQKFQKSRFSSIDPIYFLNKLTSTLINECFATEGNACLFGGWPSHRSGRCSVPWSNAAQAVATSLESRAYDSSSYCGDANQFRCNPLIFGPGIDQGMVGDQYPNINGARNNEAPYHAGICVDISSGYDGLSEKCQAASERLDELRRTHNMAPWRESDFFNEERAAQFRGLQGLIADRCRANREQLNADNMCTSLENSLGLTAAAVEANRMGTLTPDDLFPQCAGTRRTPRCDGDTSSDFDKMVAAIERLKNNRECNFQAVQAIDGDSLSNMMEFTPGPCLNPIEGALRTSGFPNGDTEFAFHFIGSEGVLGRISISLNKNTTPDEIVRMLTTQGNEAAFNSLCNEAACPRENEDRRLSGLYAALESIKSRENCNFGSVQAVDSATGDIEAFEPRNCSLSVEGNLASNGLPFQAGMERGRQPRVPIAINIRDRSGRFLRTLRIEASSDFTQGDYLAQINQEELRAVCLASMSNNLTDDDSARGDVGVTADTFVPAFWQERMADLRNVANRAEIEGFRVEVRPNGDLILHADEPNLIIANQAAFLAVINNDPDVSSRASFIREGDAIRVAGTPATARVEALVNSSGATLTADETATLTEIVDGGIDLRSFERDNNGTLRLNLVSSSGGALSSGEFNGYRVREEEIADGRGRRVILTPVTAAPTEDTPVRAAEITFENNVVGILREPAADGGSGSDPRITLDHVTSIAPTHNMAIQPENRVAMVFESSTLGTYPRLRPAYNLMVEMARTHAITATEVVNRGRAINITVDLNGQTEPTTTQLVEIQQRIPGGASIIKVGERNGRIIYRINR